MPTNPLGLSSTSAGPSAYANAVLANDPISYWRLDETSGTTAFDLEHVNNGIYVSNPTLDQPGAIAGDSDTAVSFNGSTQYVSVPYVAALNPSRFSVEVWAKPTGGAGSYRGVLASRNFPQGWVLYAGGNNLWQFWINNGASMLSVSGGPITLNTWTYLVATFDGTTARFYVNGVMHSSGTVSTYQAQTLNPLTIGQSQPGSGFYFPGSIDEPAVYGSALTASQIQSDYALGSQGTTSTPVPTADATATNTPTPTHTATYTPSATPTNTSVATATRTSTSSATASPTSTRTSTALPTTTPTSSPTATPTASASPSPTATRSSTATSASTATPTRTGTVTNTPSATATPSPTASGSTWYVSRNGNNTTGNSWTNAWNELSAIKWSSVSPGDTILIDGGTVACSSPVTPVATSPYGFGAKPGQTGDTCGMLYNTTLALGKSGTSGKAITIQLASDSGHNGTAIFFGGRTTDLPDCSQPTYTVAYSGNNLSSVITTGTSSYVTIDGTKRSGIMVYGGQNGIQIGSPSATNLTFQNMEVFDNGIEGKGSDPEGGSFASSGYGSDNPGVWVEGSNLTFSRMLIHDNGQDDIQSESYTTPALSNLLVTDSWLYFSRENAYQPGWGFNTGNNEPCHHPDGTQLFSGNPNTGLTIQHSIVGPYLAQGTYPADSGTPAETNNVTINDVWS